MVIDIFKHILPIYPSILLSNLKGVPGMAYIQGGGFVRFVLAVAAVASLSSAGCKDPGPPKPKTVPVTGKVMYKGQPVASATVAFLGDGKIRAAFGKTDSEGRFELTTSEAGDGAVPGMHKVTVTKVVGSKAAKAASGPVSMEDALKRSNEPKKDEEPMSLLPDMYADAATSGLSFDVKESGTNDFTIDLKD